MDLKPLFEMQRNLDDRIIEEKVLEGQDLPPEKILALQVELGELANEWRGFKFWSEDREPRIFAKCKLCSGRGNGYFSGEKWTGKLEICTTCSGNGIDKTRNPLLEEYVDCLHFILSIGLELEILEEWSVDEIEVDKEVSITHQFLAFNRLLNDEIDAQEWFEIMSLFIGLGEMLGFTWEKIENAYKEKNATNHLRQSNGY